LFPIAFISCISSERQGGWSELIEVPEGLLLIVCAEIKKEIPGVKKMLRRGAENRPDRVMG
jgi:hypothetical protein